MKVTLNLTNPLWNTEERRALLDKVVQQSAAELESAIKQTILNSQPAGKVYGRGPITKAASKQNLALGLRRLSGNRNKVVAGTKIHRASAPGQPPAVLSSGLLNSIRAKKRGILSATVSTSKQYAAALDKGTTRAGRNRRTVIKPRPFFGVTAEKFRAKFKQNIADAIDKETS